MNLFLALIEIDRFEALKKIAGYAAATTILATLARVVARDLPGCTDARADRATIEVTLASDSPRAASAALAALAGQLAGRISIEGYGFDIAVNIGAADARGQTITDELVGVAERALTLARLSRAPVVLSEPAGQAPATDAMAVMRDLQRAIEADALELYYQPKVRSRTGAVASVEALLRWHDPVHGWRLPNMVIPIAEETGDIAALTEWVVKRAIADQRRLLERGFAMPVHVNLSGVLLGDAAYTARLLALIATAPGEIGIEVTETAMISDPDGALANLNALAEAGVKLAIDDYGSGFSSLAYLQQLPVHELKIDRMFVSRLSSGQRDPLLVRSTIDLAHALEMEVTAEGVEAPEALALLQVMGCDMVQGYLLARPMPLAALIDFLSEEAGRIEAAFHRPVQHRLRRRRPKT